MSAPAPRSRSAEATALQSRGADDTTYVSLETVAGDGRAGAKTETAAAAVVVPKTQTPASPSWVKPLLLKRHSKIPKQWDRLDGTAVLIDKPKGESRE